jgi:hypothetical protein
MIVDYVFIGPPNRGRQRPDERWRWPHKYHRTTDCPRLQLRGEFDTPFRVTKTRAFWGLNRRPCSGCCPPEDDGSGWHPGTRSTAP